MTKFLATALLSILVAGMVLYAMQPVDAAVPPQASLDTLSPDRIGAIDLSMPPPREPLDTTPITPVETVGASAYEPF
ncbi:hypothetical protein QTH90_10215 [Variovorax sp. J2P1-59]|uniref:hypothetical protein n=1 Tax=Variovorax flavidus TaxID=3053501 RepID=UPI0025778853|nr:hypothetical protein [Variovorax sp. J2P1-59]MDM0074757.1 hypothetical protein [Variovorax sp. J2P1-59]